MVDLGTIIESVVIPNTVVDGVAQVQVDEHGTARLALYCLQLEADGSTSPVVAARLTMRRDVMREIADRMQNASMVSHYRSERDIAELRRKLT